ALTRQLRELVWPVRRADNFAMPKKTKLLRRGLRRMPNKRSTRLRSPQRRKARRASKRRSGLDVPKKAPRYVYYFGDGYADGTGKMKPLLGGKGANLAEMTRIGLPVPPGFTMTTEVCTYFYEHKRSYPAQLKKEVAT